MRPDPNGVRVTEVDTPYSHTHVHTVPVVWEQQSHTESTLGYTTYRQAYRNMEHTVTHSTHRQARRDMGTHSTHKQAYRDLHS